MIVFFLNRTYILESVILTRDVVNLNVPDDKSELKDAFRDLLPLASHWKTIGTLLGVQAHILHNIRSEEDEVHRGCCLNGLSRLTSHQPGRT